MRVIGHTKVATDLQEPVSRHHLGKCWQVEQTLFLSPVVPHLRQSHNTHGDGKAKEHLYLWDAGGMPRALVLTRLCSILLLKVQVQVLDKQIHHLLGSQRHAGDAEVCLHGHGPQSRQLTVPHPVKEKQTPSTLHLGPCREKLTCC